MSRAFDRFDSWPIALQVVGGLLFCFGVGFVAGFGWGLAALGLQAIVSGALAEAK